MPESSPKRTAHPWLFVLYGGIVAGTLDMAYACIFWGVKSGVSAQRIFQSVTVGLLGEAAHEGGTATAALGLGLHYFIATSMSVTYYLVAGRWPLLRERPVLCGAGYGLLLYAIMNCIVVHMFLIGIPIALFARKAHAAKT